MQDHKEIAKTIETIEIPVTVLESILASVHFLTKESEEFRINNPGLKYRNKEEVNFAKAESEIEAQKQIVRIKQVLKAGQVH